MDVFFAHKKKAHLSLIDAPLIQHDHDTNAATARLPTYSSPSSQRLSSEIACVDLQIWDLKISNFLRTNIAMHHTDINNENIGNSAINIILAIKSDFQLHHHRLPLVIHICYHQWTKNRLSVPPPLLTRSTKPHRTPCTQTPNLRITPNTHENRSRRILTQTVQTQSRRGIR